MIKLNFKPLSIYIFKPKIFIFPVALFNFIWFSSKAKWIVEFGSEVISFCCYCAWYYEGAHAAKPFILLFATLFMVFNRWWGYLITAVISGLYVIEGIIWISRRTGFVGGLSERIELISTNLDSKIWQFLDWQYLLALIIFITASGYFAAGIYKIKQNSKIALR